MAQRTVPPEKVKTLAEWVARWPKATNLGFDPETREPTVYSANKERTRVSSIPWKREADTLTVLAQPSRFSAQAVAAAAQRFGRVREERDELRRGAEERLRTGEAALLEAWRRYHAEPAATRAPLRREVLTAESEVRAIEAESANPERMAIAVEDKVGIYVPPMPLARRGINMVEGP
jgi:hypothetical protein